MVVRGELADFGAFYERTYPRAFGIAFGMTGERGLAEDVAQDAFVAAFRQRTPALHRPARLDGGRLDGTAWTLHGDDDVIIGGGWEGLSVGPDGAVWVAGSNGLRRLAGDRWRTLHDGLSFEAVSVAPDGSVWALGPSGLVRFVPD